MRHCPCPMSVPRQLIQPGDARYGLNSSSGSIRKIEVVGRASDLLSMDGTSAVNVLLCSLAVWIGLVAKNLLD